MQTAFYEIMKAVLVIDMPKTCKECKCQLCWVCVPADEDIDEYIDPSKAKPDWCPLRPLPKYRDNSKKPQDYAEVWIDGAKTGWNACLDEVTGETECTTQKMDT